MEALPEDAILQFSPNTLEFIRKQHNLDQPGRIAESIDILCDWLLKQDHLVKKNYAREYLERIIINCKGSVERAKMKLDKICTYRTLLSVYFEPFEFKDNPAINNIIDAFLPKMTDDHNRVVLLRNSCKKFDFTLLDWYKCFLLKCEYLQSRDYCNGVIIVLDYRELNITEFMKLLNLTEMKEILSIITEGYGMRIKGIHIITPSRTVDVLVNLLKQFMSKKLSQRIHVHKSLNSIYSIVPKDIMPIEYGGKEQSLQGLSEKIKDIFVVDPFKTHIEDMRIAGTIEALRRRGDGNAECIGMPGSFRKFIID